MAKHAHLHEVTKTIAKDLKCDYGNAMAHAIEGVAAVAKVIGLRVSPKPDAAEVESILQHHLPLLEKLIADSAINAKGGKVTPPPPKGRPHLRLV